MHSSCPRAFGHSCARNGHYQTLGVPSNATRSQIKASYYKLSKRYHPDVNNDPFAKERFQAVSDAYAILGDERQRRAYDKTLTAPVPTHPHTHHDSSHPHWPYEGRKRGATHAWEYSRRPHTQHSYAYQRPPGPPPFPHAHQSEGPNPFASPNVQRATGRKGPLPTSTGPPHTDHVAQESTLWRAVQVTALVLLIGTIGHGLSASA